MSDLYDRAKAVVDSSGLLHQRYLQALRLYIKTMAEQDLIDEIKNMNNIDVLRALWEAGLSAPLQTAVLDRVRIVTMGR
jgi:hypothetical protein